MPTRNVSLTPDQDAFIEKVIESGVEALARGDFVQVDEPDLVRYLMRPRASRRKPAR